MPLSNYPGGFPGGVSILGMPVLNTHGGNVFWVNSNGGGNGNPGTRNKPFASLDYAIGRCTANNGDIIMLMPNHAETLTGAAAVVFDVAGITVIGMGQYNNRPRFLLDAGTTVDIDVTADDVTIENCVFASGHSDVATCFDLDAKGFRLLNCEFVDNTTHENFLVGITSGSTTDNVCDGLTLIGNKFYTATDSHTAFATLVGDIDYMHVEGNIYMQGAPGGSAGSAGIFLNGTAGDDWNNALVKGNIISIQQTATDSYPIGGGNAEADNTGLIMDNVLATRMSVGTSAAIGQNLLTKGAGFTWMRNHFSGKGTDPGQIIPFPTSGGAVY